MQTSILEVYERLYSALESMMQSWCWNWCETSRQNISINSASYPYWGRK